MNEEEIRKAIKAVNHELTKGNLSIGEYQNKFMTFMELHARLKEHIELKKEVKDIINNFNMKGSKYILMGCKPKPVILDGRLKDELNLEIDKL